MKEVALGFAFAMFLLIVSCMLGFFWYQSDIFEAKVESIEYYHAGSLFSSATKAVVEFDNGMVVDVWEVPRALRVGEVYEVDYRTPYFMKDPYLVVK